MKPKILVRVTTTAWFAALAIPARMSAQEQQAKKHPPRYTVTDLGTLGGTFSVAEGINNKGWAGGIGSLPGDNNSHAVLWVRGLKIDLGTFGGPNSATIYAPNEAGQAAGSAETSVSDPLGEDYCGNGTHLVCLPFIWQYGIKIPLRIPGGNNGEGAAVNKWGQVVGNAETAAHDSTCVPPQVLQYLPVVWEKGQVKALPTFLGDPDGV